MIGAITKAGKKINIRLRSINGVLAKRSYDNKILWQRNCEDTITMWQCDAIIIYCIDIALIVLKSSDSMGNNHCKNISIGSIVDWSVVFHKSERLLLYWKIYWAIFCVLQRHFLCLLCKKNYCIYPVSIPPLRCFYIAFPNAWLLVYLMSKIAFQEWLR